MEHIKIMKIKLNSSLKLVKIHKTLTKDYVKFNN
jgi:hypothetical protein